MLEIPGTTSYSKENRIEARDAAKCDQMPAMQRRGSGDLVEPAKKKEEGGPGARGLGQTGGQLGQPGWREWGVARPTMGTFQNVDWCDVGGLCRLPVVSLSCSSRVANPAGCKSCKSGSRTTVWHADGYANGMRRKKKGYAPGPNTILQHRDSFLTALVRSCVGRYHSLPPPPPPPRPSPAVFYCRCFLLLSPSLLQRPLFPFGRGLEQLLLQNDVELPGEKAQWGYAGYTEAPGCEEEEGVGGAGGGQGLAESGPSCIPQNPIITPSVRGSDRQDGACRRVASTVASLGVCPVLLPSGRPKKKGPGSDRRRHAVKKVLA